MPDQPQKRVLTIAPLPPEKAAYALARYSRSPDSIRDSIEWVRTHDSRKFLESFYFQYGHASIADLGHVTLCFEGVSELAAVEIEDEQLWDGQARSSRYQDFGRSGFVTPPEFNAEQAALYQSAGKALLAAYKQVHAQMCEYLAEKLPRPESMKPDAYQRNIAARAFDVARYLLFFGVPTGVGQVTSIRTLEKQIRRMKASEFAEVRELGAEAAAACAEEPSCLWGGSSEPVAPTLAKYVEPDDHVSRSRDDLRAWAQQNMPPATAPELPDVDLLKPAETESDIVATLLYSVTDRPYRVLYEMACAWGAKRRAEVIDVALQSRSRRDELLGAFRGGPYVYDMVMDIGAYRDLHRHRRCQQFRQAYGRMLGYSVPAVAGQAGLEPLFQHALDAAFAATGELPSPAGAYLLPFATRARFLFRMDFAESEYIARLRSGVKGHFSYREIAWKMKEQMSRLEPSLGRLMSATPPEIEDPLQR
ncbi:MAG: FAD-dependent thymidylate synthase [Bryobacteraceae bacterium]|nr:FAD-dependent thymidylate synthase [Bryobacteraceae bacterium]